MKKLLAVLTVLCFSFSSSTYYFADSKVYDKAYSLQPISTVSVESNLIHDLTKLSSLYTTKEYQELTIYTNELLVKLNEQREFINTLGSLYYLGYAENKIDAVKLKKLLQWSSEYSEQSLLFSSSYFKEYMQLRINKLDTSFAGKAKYDTKGIAANSVKNYEEFAKSFEKDKAAKDKLFLILQDKLLDKLISEDVADKEKYLYDILSLRLESNMSVGMQYIYELFESQIRLRILEKIIYNNNKIVKELAVKVDKTFTVEEDSNVKSDAALKEASTKSAELLSTMLAAYGESAKLIMQEISKHKVYGNLKGKGISNAYTASFENSKQQYTKNLNLLLSGFAGEGGTSLTENKNYEMSDFVIFIKDFLDYSRTIDSQDIEGRKMLIKFRQSVLQFMPIQEASFLILDTLYRINIEVIYKEETI